MSRCCHIKKIIFEKYQPPILRGLKFIYMHFYILYPIFLGVVYQFHIHLPRLILTMFSITNSIHYEKLLNETFNRIGHAAFFFIFVRARR